KQAFNIKHGINPKAFCIKDRVAGIPPQGQGANKGRSVDVDQMVSDYWREYGWDPETGRPKGEITTEFSQEAVPLKHDSGEDIIGYEDAYR
ncbi:MAG: aldehyde ferredoxin oxidoreductase C-terminal domain-containing protein, partial [Thermodesulfobacteriota bacterium]|nr:aldehyde ferredoxin oxidoreductase C-terminal domain-containing protein [Thermodesulfobacteriota bacterium]